jgi:hypothetical protein
MVRYFEWMGAAVYTADRRAGAMHGKRFLLDSVYAGIDDANVYGRLDFAEQVPEMKFELVVNLESWAADAHQPKRALRLDVEVEDRKTRAWKVIAAGEDKPLAASDHPGKELKLALARNFEFRLPLRWLQVTPIPDRTAKESSAPAVTRLRLRFSLWHNHLPVDALPLEGWIELPLLSEAHLMMQAY